ncbi:MAG: cation transporter [Chitinophagaceae bacterium]|nr:cation transporter [Oligoflexus sp.]
MGKDCCGAKEEALSQLRRKQSKVLKVVLVANAIMFLVEFSYGWTANSTSLLADSLDMFGDAVVYAFSLFVLYKSQRWRAGAGLLKGLIMLAFGIGVLGDAFSKALNYSAPDAPTMGMIGGLALVANVGCLLILLRHRDDDINMRSTWICSRNDIVSNVGVIVASFAVTYTHSKWPDILFGVLIAGVFIRSSLQVIVEANTELKLRPSVGPVSE